MLHFGRGGEGVEGCSLSSYIEPDDAPRVGSLMLSWAGKNGRLTPSSLECVGLLHYTLTVTEASDRNPCLAPSVLAARIESFFFSVLLVFSSCIFSHSPGTSQAKQGDM